MHTTQVIALAFALAGAMAAPAASKGPKVEGTKNLYYCADPSTYAFSVSDVSVTPKIPMPGNNVTVSIAGNLKSEVAEGSTQKMVIGTIENGQEKVLFTGIKDLCASLSYAPDALDVQQCPIAAGPFNWSHSFELPSPPENFDISKIDPSKVKDAIKKIEAMKAKAKANAPKGEFYFRNQLIDAQGKVLSCVYADIKNGVAANGTAAASAPAGTGAALSATA